MSYVVQYSISGLFLMALLVVLFFARRKYPTKTNNYYAALLCLATASAALNIISCYAISLDIVPIWLNYVINTAYILCYNLTGLAFYVYTSAVLSKFTKDRYIKPIVIVGAVLYIVFLLPTPFTHLVISFETGHYEHGPLFMLFYVYPLALLVLIFFRILKHRKQISTYHASAICLMVVGTIVTVVVQAFFPRYIFQDLASALFLLLLYMTLQNPDNYMDTVTGCFNSTAFYETYDSMASSKSPFTIVFFTLEGFEQISDFFGKRAREETINSLSLSLMERFGNYNVYHLQETHCYAIFVDKRQEMGTDKTIYAIKEMFSAPYEVKDGVSFMFTPFVCVLNYPDFELAPADIPVAIEDSFKRLEDNHDLPYVVISAESLEKSKREKAIVNKLKQAIRNESFEVYYQPIYSVAEKRFVAAEALVRLKDAELGFLAPDEFVPIAEQNGMIIEIGEQVFQRVCHFIKYSGVLEKFGLEYIDVNLSMVQCVQQNLAARLMATIYEYKINPASVNFEITETRQFINEGVLKKNMNAIIRQGSSFSMDDYGTGFSTTDYLVSLPAKTIKIDKSILWSAMKDERAQLVLQYTIAMLRALKKKIVVEGVETPEMAHILEEMGCDMLQGFLFSKPLPQDEFVEFLEKSSANS